MAEKQKELFAAIEAKDFEKAANLIESGVDVNSHDEGGMSVLAAAAYRGSSDLVQLCIDKGANVNDKEHNQGYTPLMFAALAGRPDICKNLMDHGARSYSTNSIGKTASELAAFVGK
ncbi:ankyrin repeat protein, partial [Ostertagia ostertagi]